MTSRPLTAKLQTTLLGLVLALTFFLAGCAHPPREEVKPRASGSIIKTAKLQMGAPLRRGGTSPRSGFDCSGFVQWVFEQHGLNLARTTREQKRQGRRVKKKALRPADLVFFSSPKSRGRVSHVGIYLGRGRFIHVSSGAKKVKTDRLAQAYWTRHYMTARRLLR